MKVNWKYLLLVGLLYVGVFWAWIQYGLVSIFGYWDELYSLMFMFLICKLLVERRTFVQKEEVIIFLLLVGYCGCCLAGNFISGYAEPSTFLQDFFLNLKFFLSLFLTGWLTRNIEYRDYSTRIMKHVYALTVVFLVLFLVDKAIGIFPVYEQRFGISSEQFFFPHPTFCAAALFFLLIQYCVFGDINKKRDVIGMLSLCFLIAMTLRFKAIATVMLFVMLFVLFKIIKIKKINLGLIVAAGAVVFALAYKHVYFYFFSDVALNMPRGAILNTSLLIARDYFPFGTGFGTFGSFISGVDYSPVYEIYKIDHIYGMTRELANAISDNYWPMILGQAGIIGFLCMLSIWICLYKKIDTFREHDLQLYLAGMGCFIYMLISSTSESAIVNPVCVPFAFVLGLMFTRDKNENDNIQWRK